MKIQKPPWKERLIWLDHRVRERTRRLVGIEPLVSADMTRDRITRRFLRTFIDPENAAIRRLVEELGSVSYLDIGAGTGRFVKISKDRASHITAVEISDRCISAMHERFRPEIETGRVRLIKSDVVHSPLPQGTQADVVVCIGNTFSIFYTEGGIAGAVRGVQKLLSSARKEVVLTLHSRAILRESLKYYRINGDRTTDYTDGLVRGYLVDERGTHTCWSSKKFSRTDVEKLMDETGIPIGQYELTAVNPYVWIVRIQKTSGDG